MKMGHALGYRSPDGLPGLTGRELHQRAEYCRGRGADADQSGQQLRARDDGSVNSSGGATATGWARHRQIYSPTNVNYNLLTPHSLQSN
jgi:hypothetical protein